MEDIKGIKAVAFGVVGLGEAVVNTAAEFERLNASLKAQLAGGDVSRYPLYCVDRGDRVDPESQYRGPYKTHDEALSNTEDSRDLVRRCRQLRPSEIAFDRDTATLAEFEVFSALVDDLDEAATTGNLPEGTWHRVGERAVFDKYDDGTLPNAQNYDTWVNDHLSVDAWICEGDE